MSTSVRDSWLKQKPANKLGLINQKLVIPAFSFPCGESRKSLRFDPSTGLQFRGSTDGLPDLRTAVTLEAWFKLPYNLGAVKRPIFNRSLNSGLPQWEFGVYGASIYLSVTNGGVATDFTTVDSLIRMNEWNHVAIVWDSSDGIAYTILNSAERELFAAFVPPDAIGIGGGTILGYEWVGQNKFLGNINEIRIWNEARTYDQIIGAMHAPRNIIAGDGIDDNLKYYFKCKELSTYGGVTGPLDEINPNSPRCIINAVVDENDYYPLRYGASIVAAQDSIDLGKKISFKFPVIPPDNVNHALVIRWTDDNDIIQRRYLYKPDGVDASIDQYLGEKVLNPFYIEIWNIDGNATVDLDEDLILKISTTTQPTIVVDTESEEAASVALSNSIYEPFPWNFPINFNTPPTYPI